MEFLNSSSAMEPRNKAMKEKNSKLVNMDVNNADFKMFKKSTLQMFFEEGNALIC